MNRSRPSPVAAATSPGDLDRLIADAERALGRGDLAAADRLFAGAASLASNDVRVIRLHGLLLFRRGHHREALASLEHVAGSMPDDPVVQHALGIARNGAGDYDRAVAAFERTCALAPGNAGAWFNLGALLTMLARTDEAIAALERACALDPRLVSARVLLIDLTTKARGDMARAEAEYRQVLASQPQAGWAWWGLANLKTARFGGDDIASLQTLVDAADLGEIDRIACGFALAKALDDRGDVAASFDALGQANTRMRRRQPWDRAACHADMDALLDAFTPPLAGSSAQQGGEVVFIVSLPRSGSTLTEQILASHPQIEGGNELPELPRVLIEESARRGKRFPLWVRDASPADWQRLGERYLARTERWRRRRPRFTDKLPRNWIYVGAILAMLPGARVVNCRRDALETCFACYRQLFTEHGFCYDLEDMAAYWREYDRISRRWREDFPDRFRDQHYEALLADPEANTRELLAFCGLPFDPACLRFHETERAVRTPSAGQVREPLRRDTARAERYGALLDPLRAALAASPKKQEGQNGFFRRVSGQEPAGGKM
ncbi:MAG TPA: sulfotransferase [Rhodanobacteraceae bacterium]|nr:sulfotransferase [Rhodanobacteraceae bacterium]